MNAKRSKEKSLYYMGKELRAVSQQSESAITPVNVEIKVDHQIFDCKPYGSI